MRTPTRPPGDDGSEMTTAADDSTVENAFEAYLAGRPVPEEAAGTFHGVAAFAEAVRGAGPPPRGGRPPPAGGPGPPPPKPVAGGFPPPPPPPPPGAGRTGRDPAVAQGPPDP